MNHFYLPMPTPGRSYEELGIDPFRVTKNVQTPQIPSSAQPQFAPFYYYQGPGPIANHHGASSFPRPYINHSLNASAHMATSFAGQSQPFVPPGVPVKLAKPIASDGPPQDLSQQHHSGTQTSMPASASAHENVHPKFSKPSSMKRYTKKAQDFGARINAAFKSNLAKKAENFFKSKHNPPPPAPPPSPNNSFSSQKHGFVFKPMANLSGPEIELMMNANNNINIQSARPNHHNYDIDNKKIKNANAQQLSPIGEIAKSATIQHGSAAGRKILLEESMMAKLLAQMGGRLDGRAFIEKALESASKDQQQPGWQDKSGGGISRAEFQWKDMQTEANDANAYHNYQVFFSFDKNGRIDDIRIKPTLQEPGQKIQAQIGKISASLSKKSAIEGAYRYNHDLKQLNSSYTSSENTQKQTDDFFKEFFEQFNGTTNYYKLFRDPDPLARYQDMRNETAKIRNSNKQYENIALEDLMAIRAYTHKLDTWVNPALREGNARTLDVFAPPVKCLISGLNQLPPYKKTVYRGAELDLATIAKYKPGETITEEACTSTTANKKTTFDRNVKFVIKSKTGKDISKLSQSPDEKEVLFRPGTQFKVLDVKQKKGKDPNFPPTTIYLTEV